MALMQQPDLGRHIREARIGHGYTQTRLGEITGLSVQMIKAVESGSRCLGPASYRRVLQAIGGGGGRSGAGDGDGAAGGMGAADAETILASCWALFYGANAAAARPTVDLLIRQLTPQAEDNPLVAATLGRCYQLAGVIARDERAISNAQAFGLRSVQLARSGASTDNLASALFRLARTHQIGGHGQAALIAMREAYELSGRCRNPLRGWLLLARVETEAKVRGSNPLPMSDLQRWIDLARAELANRPGQDESFTALNRHGISHVEAMAVILRGDDPARAISILRNTAQELDKNDPQAHRWRYGIQATEAFAYAAHGDAESAAAMAEDVKRLTRSTSHMRYLQWGKDALLARDPGRTSRAVRRYCEVVEAISS
jgi:DNA-binding XRE family transcriptional regulator